MRAALELEAPPYVAAMEAAAAQRRRLEEQQAALRGARDDLDEWTVP